MPSAGFAEREKKLYWRLDCCSEWLHSLYSGCLWFIFFMSDKQAAVIYQRVTRRVASQSWRNNTCLLSYFSSMYFHVFFDKLSNKLWWLLVSFIISILGVNSKINILSEDVNVFVYRKNVLKLQVEIILGIISIIILSPLIVLNRSILLFFLNPALIGFP